jgi:thioesterase domain-containing protein
MARCLLASGERVNLVGLIDTRRPITRLTPRLNIHPLHSIIAELSGRLAFLLSRTARVLVDKSAFTRLRMILSMAALLQSKDAVDFRFWLTALVRRKAIETVANAPLELPTTLFRSGDEWPGPYDYGWGALCKQLIITNVGGAHDTIFQPEGLDVLRERTVEAVETAMRRGRLAG